MSKILDALRNIPKPGIKNEGPQFAVGNLKSKKVLLASALMGVAIAISLSYHVFKNESPEDAQPIVQDEKNNYQEALLAFKVGNHQKALDLFLSLQDEFHDKSALFNNIGLCYKKLGSLDLAVQYYNKALAARPENGYAHNNLAMVLQELGDEGALKHFEQALALIPKQRDVHINAAHYFEGRGLWEEARDSYLQLIQYFQLPESKLTKVKDRVRILDSMVVSFNRYGVKRGMAE